MENVHAGWRRKLMKYIADTVDFQLEEPTVVTLGKFDGRHRGHQKLLHTMEELKETLGYASAISWIVFIVILTFTLVLFASSKLWVHYADE